MNAVCTSQLSHCQTTRVRSGADVCQIGSSTRRPAQGPLTHAQVRLRARRTQGIFPRILLHDAHAHVGKIICSAKAVVDELADHQIENILRTMTSY